MMKYLIAGFFALVLIIGYFINQSNKADAERLKRAEIAHQQKLKQDVLDINQAKKDAAELKAQKELDRIKANEATVALEQDKQKSQIELAAQKVKEKLLDSDSAKFRNQKDNCGEVNSKNRMGGYVGFSRYIYFPDDGTLMIESDSKDSIITPQVMDAMWSAKCN